MKLAANRGGFVGRHWRDVLALTALAAASVLVLLVGLSRAPVYLWDEGRVAMNAFEMMHGASPFILSYHGEPDFWNPKPPLAIILSVFSMSLLGLNELALRLPAAAAAVATVLSVFFFTRWASGSRATGLLAGLILLGTGGYVEAHVARSAEPDSLLVLFSTAATFALVRSVDEGASEKTRDRWWYAVGAALACAMLTKGIAAFLMVPGYAAALLFQRRVHLLNRDSVRLVAVGLILLAILYWGGRELAQPEFAAAVWRRDLAPGLQSVSEAGAPWYYYIPKLVWPWLLSPFFGSREFHATASAFPWILMLPVCAPLAALSSYRLSRDSASFVLWSLLGFILVVSATVSKLPWYIAPAYPLIAVLTALGAREAGRLLSKRKSATARLLATLIIPGSMAAAAVCIGFVIWKSKQQDTTAATMPGQRLGYFLRQTAAELPRDRPIRVLSEPQFETPAVRGGRFAGTEPYDGPTEFYVDALRRSGYDIRLVGRDYRRRPGDLVIGCGLVSPGYSMVSTRWRSGDCFAAS